MAAMTPEGAALIKEMWEKRISLDVDHYGVDFFLAIFARAPHVKYMFSFIQENPTEADLRKNYFLQKHSSAAMQYAGECMSLFGDKAGTVEAFARLRKLGKMHSKYAVVEAGFPVVKDSLLEVLRKNLGDELKPDTEAAFAIGIEIAVKEMKAGLQEGYSRRHRRSGISL